MSAECSHVESSFPVLADSPLGSPTPLPNADLVDDAVLIEPLYFVLWKAIDNGLWRVWIRDNGEQAFSHARERVEAFLVEAKKSLDHTAKSEARPTVNRLAAVELRLAETRSNEL